MQVDCQALKSRTLTRKALMHAQKLLDKRKQTPNAKMRRGLPCMVSLRDLPQSRQRRSPKTLEEPTHKIAKFSNPKPKLPSRNPCRSNSPSIRGVRTSQKGIARRNQEPKVRRILRLKSPHQKSSINAAIRVWGPCAAPYSDMNRRHVSGLLFEVSSFAAEDCMSWTAGRRGGANYKPESLNKALKPLNPEPAEAD